MKENIHVPHASEKWAVSNLINDRVDHLYIIALATLLLPCLEIHSFIITPLHIFATRIVK